jgi:hypothetical protein
MGPCWCPLCSYERCVEDNPEPSELEILYGSLCDFASWGDTRQAEDARDALLNALRAQNLGPLNIIADMLDPAGDSYWRLDLERRGRGARPQMGQIALGSLAFEYDRRLEELKEERRASPAKTARGELAAKYQMTDEQIRALIERQQGKRQRRPGGKRGKS